MSSSLKELREQLEEKIRYHKRMQEHCLLDNFTSQARDEAVRVATLREILRLMPDE